jgi:hypothetical protein
MEYLKMEFHKIECNKMERLKMIDPSQEQTEDQDLSEENKPFLKKDSAKDQ